MGAGAGAKRVMDVEDVVRWACGFDLRPPGAAPRGRPPSLRDPSVGLTRAEASLVGRWTWPAGYPEISPMFALGLASDSRGAGRRVAPDADASLIGEAVAMLADALQGARAPEAIVEGIGFAVDLEGAFAAGIANAANLVLAHGRRASRPSLAREAMAPIARVAPNGKPGVWRGETRLERTLEGRELAREVEIAAPPLRRDLYPAGAYCRLDWTPDPQMVVNERAEYAAWRLALERLCEMLRGRLERIAAIAPAAAFAPWRGERDGDKPAHMFGRGATRVYSRQGASGAEASRKASVRRKPALSAHRPRRPAKPARGAASG